MPQTLHQILEYCLTQQISISSQQELILSTIIQSLEPITAHEILSKLKENNPKANRMTIHRALEYLSRMNLIHKIAFNHTYSLCNHLNTHSCQILVCQKCGRQIELHSAEIKQILLTASLPFGFKISNPLEITGYCQQCAT